MAGYGYDRDSAETCGLLNAGSECADYISRIYKFSETVGSQTCFFEQFRVKFTCGRVENLRCRCYGTFSHGVACEHIAESIWHEEDFIGDFKSVAVLFAEGMELEQCVEVHELDAGLFIDFLAGHLLAEFVDRTGCVWITVAVGETCDSPVGVEIGHVASPSVDTDRTCFRTDFSEFDRCVAQTGEHFVV